MSALRIKPCGISGPHGEHAWTVLDGSGMRLCPGAPKPLAEQIRRLAQFIIDEIDGEPSQEQGAIDTAIRLLSRAKELHGDRAFSADGAALEDATIERGYN